MAEFNLNTLILFVPGQVSSDDWRVKLAGEINDIIRKEDTEINMFNLVLPYVNVENKISSSDTQLDDLAQLLGL